MRKLNSLIGAAVLTSAFGIQAFAASPDVYVVNFRSDTDAASTQMDGALAAAIATAGINAEEVVIDTSNAARWEKSAHAAFNRDIVPVFNKWVGLPGFAAVVDAKTKKVIGCVNGKFSANEMAAEIRKMAKQSQGQAYMSRASVGGKTTRCPEAHNELP